jgi:ATP-binding cassette subfamily B protein
MLRLLREASPTLYACFWIDLFAKAVLPNVVLVALGVMVGRIPAAAQAGLGSPAGDALNQSILYVALAFAVTMLGAPFHQAFSSATRVRLTYSMQGRLMGAVSRPAGIAHLEDPATLNTLSLAQGSLMTWFPADAPGALVVVWANRVTTVLACGLIAWQVWWFGLALMLLWPVIRRPIMRVITEHVGAMGGNADIMRRAEYFRTMASRPVAAKEIRIFGLGDWVVDRFREAWQAGMHDVWAIRAGIYRVVVRIGVLILGVYVAGCAYLGWAAYQGSIDLRGVAIILPALGVTLVSGGVTWDDLSLAWMLSAIPHLDELEASMKERQLAAAVTPPPPAAPEQLIRFENVSFRYPGATSDALRSLSFDISAGTSTAIVGANGVGKTTLVKLLARLHDPTSGRITVDGLDLQELDPHAWQRHIAVVFQDFLRLPLSARENIGWGALADAGDTDGIVDAARRSGIDERLLSLASGLDTPLSRQFEGGTDLSGGEWQRVALARALFAVDHGARVLVLDEPTAWMDVRGEAEFFDRFLTITAGLTTIVISHRFSTVRLADNICVLSDGGLLEHGSHDQLMAAGGEYARLFELQAARFADAAPDAAGGGAA